MQSLIKINFKVQNLYDIIVSLNLKFYRIYMLLNSIDRLAPSTEFVVWLITRFSVLTFMLFVMIVYYLVSHHYTHNQNKYDNLDNYYKLEKIIVILIENTIV